MNRDEIDAEECFNWFSTHVDRILDEIDTTDEAIALLPAYTIFRERVWDARHPDVGYHLAEEEEDDDLHVVGQVISVKCPITVIYK